MTKCSCRKSPTTCGKRNAVYGGYKHSCFTLPEMYGSLAQLAGNLRRTTDVLHKLWVTNGDVRRSCAICGKDPEKYCSAKGDDTSLEARASVGIIVFECFVY